jgi:diguanylate cyclase (GGDEF)-like protein/PAS domain S-box-containing protein
MIAPRVRGSSDRLAEVETSSVGPSPTLRPARAKRVQKTYPRQSATRHSGASIVPMSSIADHELLTATVMGSPTALVVADLRGTALLWNPAAERLFGWSAADVVGQPLQLIEFSSRGESLRLRRGAAAGHSVVEVQSQRRHRDGRLVDVAVSTVGLHDPQGRVIAVLGTYQDVTERKAAQEELVRQAQRDDLTGLVNRRGLHEELQRLQSGRRSRFTVVALDLDHFKHVNDALGRAVGDQVLTLFAQRLLNSVRPGDVVARLEGALFAVVMLGMPPSALESKVEWLLEAVSARYQVGEHQAPVKVTGGVATCSKLEEPAEMLRRAEVALHYAKRVSRGGFQVLDEALDRAFLDRSWLAARLLEAADQNQLRLHFQPIVAAVSRELVGVEALVRWQHPERGLLGPNEFIPLAEESGSISSIGRWVLRESCATLKQWTDAEPAAAHLTVSVNLSVAELQDRNLVDEVAVALKRSGLAPERLHLEVTESVLSADPEAAAQALTQLRDLGVCLVIDDFGTGNSSLTALQRFPFRVLKIDRSFVGGIGLRSDDEIIVTATVALAHGLGLSVVAEGVETPEQAEFLTRGGCEELQGYLLGRPAPANVIRPLLATECMRGRLAAT